VGWGSRIVSGHLGIVYQDLRTGLWLLKCLKDSAQTAVILAIPVGTPGDACFTFGVMSELAVILPEREI